uniref:TRAF3-interacting protein 1 n=1 Tax=Timema douglasi TaxID=61478 RepID=A0A7R8VCJ7_TIMDO|nr:unnamed protein product [Timema douglasi]
MSEDIKPEVIKRTQDTLGKFIKKPPLTDKLLRKPPFRFLHDVITSVIRETGFLKGLLSTAEMNHENIKDRESKVAFLQKIIDAVKAITGEPLTVKPTKIVAGHEPSKTNELLQAIAKALQNKSSSSDYVEQLKKGKSIKPVTNKDTTNKTKALVANKQVAPTPRTQSRDRSKTKDIDKQKTQVVTKKSRVNDSKVKEEIKKEPGNVKERKTPIVQEENNSPLATPTKSTNIDPLQTPEKVSENPPEELNSATLEENFEAKQTENQETNETKHVLNTENEATQLKLPLENEIEINNSPKVEENSVLEVKRPQSARHGSRRVSARPTADVNKSRGEVEITQGGVDQPDKNNMTPEMPTPMIEEMKPKHTPSPLQRQMSARPASARRSARPTSARPAAPRVRDRGEVALVEEIMPFVGKVNVITESDPIKEQEEDENFVVLESPAPLIIEEQQIPLTASPKTPEEGQHGHLVAQILETKKELEVENHLASNKQESQTKKVEIEWEAGRRREREMASRDVDRLRSSIQTLTRAANPLGKLMDFLHEDVDAMQRELQSWRNKNSQLVKQLHEEQSLTEKSVEPMKLKLSELQENINQQLDQISVIKASILHNDERIDKLLLGVSQT